MSRDMRIVNMSPGQLAEYDKVFKRQGEIAYRDMGVLSKIALFNSGKAIITEGLRVVSGGGMVVTIPTGSILQRITSGDILPCISTAEQTITMDAASGSPRIDIIECQVKSVTDKDDTTKAVLNPTTGVISLENIKRDLKYYLAIQKKTGTTTATAATAGVLSGTVGIAGTIDLSANYLLNIADGEDGSFQEIDLRGSTPEATTRAEIINAINTAIGRTIASTGAGDTITLTGNGTGETSYFEIKPPVSNSDADVLQTVFGVSGAGVYNYTYKGVNEWIKLCEIDIGASTTVITSALIRNIDQKSTWASDGTNVIVHDLIYKDGVVNGLDADKHDGTDVQTILDPVSDLNIPTSKATANYIKSVYVENLGSIANNSGTPNTIIDFGVGKSWSDDYTTWIADVVGMSKTSGAWSAGTGNGMLDTGSFAASKVYYLYRILNPTTSAVDYLMSLSDTSPTMPSGYTKKRLIGAVLTNSSIQFIPSNFSRPTKDIFRCDYKAQQNDRPEAAAGNTTRNLLTVSAPKGSLVLCSATIQSNSSSGNVIHCKLGSTFETDVVPSPSDNDFAVVAVTGQTAGTPSLIYQKASGNLSAIVDSNRQIYWRVSNESITSVRVATKAWQLSI